MPQSHKCELPCWFTPKPSDNESNHPHVLFWAFALSKGFKGFSEQFRARTPKPFVLKCRTGVLGSTPGTTPGRPNWLNIHIRLTGFDMTCFRCPGHEVRQDHPIYLQNSLSKVEDGKIRSGPGKPNQRKVSS